VPKTAPKRHTLPLIHPGQILKEDLDDAGIRMNRLARDIRVPMNRVSAIVNGKRTITADTALRLARYFGTSAQYWLNLQTTYELQAAEPELKDRITREVLPLDAA
jgi:addiction module HigA family antidote